MERDDLKRLLQAVADGSVSVDAACAQVAQAPFVDLGFAKPDVQRGVRQGVSEVIYGAGKTAAQIAEITAALARAGQERVLITRLSPEKKDALMPLLPAGLAGAFQYHEIPRLGIIGDAPEPTGVGPILVAAAGTSDLYCAEEAAFTAEMLGNEVRRVYDVGVAGLHRLLAHASDIQEASVIIAVAGMEGALASVIGGLAACPVIACPTSVGYGASLGGLSALLSMLNSCASGVSVVNIDNGFGAGYQASMINHVGK
jgi:NCAIR mutase (PurE)-related protein